MKTLIPNNDNDGNDDDDSDHARTESDRDENLNLNQSNEEHEEDKEEYVDEFTDKKDDDDNANKENKEESEADQHNVSQESGFEQEEDAHVTLTAVHDTQMTEGPMQSSFVLSDFTEKLLNFENVSPANNEIAFLMDTTVHHEELSGQTSTLYTIPVTSTYEAAASLSEFELTKILMDKMEEQKSYLIADYKRKLYDALTAGEVTTASTKLLLLDEVTTASGS
ncbi:hypothetical protein Tco_0238173 [Tanacetum coccineum]